MLHDLSQWGWYVKNEEDDRGQESVVNKEKMFEENKEHFHLIFGELREQSNKMFDLLLDRIRQLSEQIAEIKSITAQLKDGEVAGVIVCSESRSQFNASINRLVENLAAAHLRNEGVITEINKIKESIVDHEKNIFKLNTNFEHLQKENTDAGKDINSLNEKMDKVEPTSMYLKVSLIVIVAAVGFILKWESLIAAFRKWDIIK